jgi:hypothetical protein
MKEYVKKLTERNDKWKKRTWHVVNCWQVPHPYEMELRAKKNVLAKFHSLMELTFLLKPPIVQLLKDFPEFYWTWRFITVFTRALHWSLSCVRSIQSMPSHSISLRSILILSTHLRFGLAWGLFPAGFTTNILYTFPFSPFVLHAMPISSSLTWSF